MFADHARTLGMRELPASSASLPKEYHNEPGRSNVCFLLSTKEEHVLHCLPAPDELGGTSPLQLLQDDFESSDQEIRLKALKRVKLVADVLGPEVTRSELIPFINSECGSTWLFTWWLICVYVDDARVWKMETHACLL